MAKYRSNKSNWLLIISLLLVFVLLGTLVGGLLYGGKLDKPGTSEETSSVSNTSASSISSTSSESTSETSDSSSNPYDGVENYHSPIYYDNNITHSTAVPLDLGDDTAWGGENIVYFNQAGAHVGEPSLSLFYDESTNVTENGFDLEKAHLHCGLDNADILVSGDFTIGGKRATESYAKCGITFVNESGRGIFIYYDLASGEGSTFADGYVTSLWAVSIVDNFCVWNTSFLLDVNISLTSNLKVIRNKNVINVYVNNKLVPFGSILSSVHGLFGENVEPALLSFNATLRVDNVKVVPYVITYLSYNGYSVNAEFDSTFGDYVYTLNPYVDYEVTGLNNVKYVATFKDDCELRKVYVKTNVEVADYNKDDAYLVPLVEEYFNEDTIAYFGSIANFYSKQVYNSNKNILRITGTFDDEKGCFCNNPQGMRVFAFRSDDVATGFSADTIYTVTLTGTDGTVSVINFRYSI